MYVPIEFVCFVVNYIVTFIVKRLGIDSSKLFLICTDLSLFFSAIEKKLSLSKEYLPKGRTKKKGNQQRRKTPTTIPSVLAAFFCRLNFINRSDIFCFEFPFNIVLQLDRPVWIRNFTFLVDDFPQDMVVSPF